MRMIIRFALAAFSAALIAIPAAHAQSSPGIMAPGDAAVTAFSGIPNDQSGERIDRAGPSLRVIDLPGGGPFGLTGASKHFTATARDIGQVFGVAIDNKRAPDIFAAASAAYGLGLYRPGHGRLRNGAPGAQYTPGQFGPGDEGGGPDSIWRIDGQSGQISLFANVTFNGIQNTPASLGALAFDANTQQLFVADRATGLIHRFTLDGQDRGIFDHGTDGRQAAHLQPVPFDAATLANIQSANFDAQDPRSWGFAPAMRRVYALAMHNGRLFYSVAANSQIWSVGIAGNGAFVGDARFETAVKALRPGAEISQIGFDSHGQMFAAERGAPTGAQDFVAAADNGQNRVFRFQPKQPNDPSPGLWQVPADEYAIGLLPNFQNADGGVGLTCGRTVWSSGERLLDPGNARRGTFPTIDGLQGNDSSLVKPANVPPMQAWMVNYYDNQADPASRGHMGAIAIWNVCGGAPPPPPSGGGYIGFSCPPGTFAIDGACLVAPLCPEDTIWRGGYCIYPRCPDGFATIRGECRRPPIFCHPGEVFVRDRCIPLGCPPGLENGRNGYCHCPNDLTYRGGRCVPPPCQRDEQRNSDGRCMPNCPPGDFARSNCPCPRDEQRNRDGRCVPNCQSDRDSANCPCPRDEQRNSDGRCVPNCQSDRASANCPCPRDEQRNSDGRCVPNCQSDRASANCPCPRDEQRNSDGRCVSNCQSDRASANCPCPRDEQRNSDGRCVPNCQSDRDLANCPCPRDEQRNSDGRCVPNCQSDRASANCPCPRDEQRNSDGRCVSNCQPNSIAANCPCPQGEKRNSDGRCVKPTLSCPPGTTGDNCKPVVHHYCARGEVRSEGRCRPIMHIQTQEPSQPKCGYGERMERGHCVSQNDDNGSKFTHTKTTGGDCANNEVYRHGHCVSVDGGNDDNGPKLTHITTGTGDCGNGEVYRRGRCVSLGESKGSGGLGCSRAEYDRFGHCPTSGNDNGKSGDERSPHRGYSFGTNGNGTENGSGNDNDGGKHFRRPNYPDRDQKSDRDQNPKEGRQPDNSSGYGH